MALEVNNIGFKTSIFLKYDFKLLGEYTDFIKTRNTKTAHTWYDRSCSNNYNL